MKKISPNLVLVAVFWNCQDWVASELTAREEPEKNVTEFLNCYVFAT